VDLQALVMTAFKDLDSANAARRAGSSTAAKVVGGIETESDLGANKEVTRAWE
jgi:hypothetical protein